MVWIACVVALCALYRCAHFRRQPLRELLSLLELFNARLSKAATAHVRGKDPALEEIKEENQAKEYAK